MIWDCRRVRGLVAGAIYGELSETDRRALEAHTAKCAACRAQVAALSAFARRLERDRPELDIDLLPRVKAYLADSAPQKNVRIRWQLASAAMASLVVFALIGVQAYLYEDSPKGTGPVAGVSVVSSLTPVLDEVAMRVDQRQYSSAFMVLQKAIEANPDDPRAGEAEAKLADIAWTHLKWYPEAHAAYEQLVANHPTMYSASAESIERRNLLAEAKRFNYWPLNELDAARNSKSAAFEQFERVVARYPGTYVASLAAREMAGSLMGGLEVPEGGNAQILAMQTARERCADPIAETQLDLELGHLCREMNDPDRARDFYTRAAESGNGALAELAKNSLAGLAMADKR